MSIKACLVAIFIGASVGALIDHGVGLQELNRERVAHAKGDIEHAQALLALSEHARETMRQELARRQNLALRFASIEDELIREKQKHETDNVHNRALIVAGARQLRVAIARVESTYRGRTDSSASATSSSLGNEAGRTAELSPAFGAALFEIVDDADADARAKATYLQQYIRALQSTQIIQNP